jgi:tetrahydromethanopterin S-methyltransferase subunit F
LDHREPIGPCKTRLSEKGVEAIHKKLKQMVTVDGEKIMVDFVILKVDSLRTSSNLLPRNARVKAGLTHRPAQGTDQHILRARTPPTDEKVLRPRSTT